MTHTVRANTFEGPLGLLLELVERGRVPVTEVSIGDITSAYLERVTEIGNDSSETMGEFLQLGSRLLYIKSLALLPDDQSNDQNEELSRLNQELEDYRRFQHAGKSLGKLSTNRSWQRDVVTRLPIESLPYPDISLTILSQAFERALQRVEPVMPTGEIRTHLSQEEVSRQILARLKLSSCSLDEITSTARDRLEVIVIFLSVLELLKAGTISVRQSGQYNTIELSLNHE